MNIQLYNFHAAGASMHSGSGDSLSVLPEPSGTDYSGCQVAFSGTGDAVLHNLLHVDSPIVAVCVRVPTAPLNAPLVLTKHPHTITRADLLLHPPHSRPP